MFHPELPPRPGIHPTAAVAPDAIIGEGVEIGPHAELLAAGGAYAALWAAFTADEDADPVLA